jgi:anti-sigma-K factor RskA
MSTMTAILIAGAVIITAISAAFFLRLRNLKSEGANEADIRRWKVRSLLLASVAFLAGGIAVAFVGSKSDAPAVVESR